ncbi:MAG TPA: hypothetical protein VFS10_06325 [Pyrinomonadaceae bacterium]|nr:hypothetical protein [Pyrinomonadaceae bacterium]
MRDETTATPRRGDAPRTQGVRARFERLRGSRRCSALGLPEVAALAAAALLLLTAILSYLFLLVPQRMRAQTLETDRADLQKLLASTQTTIGTSRSTEESVNEILGSLQNFEIEHLGEGSSVGLRNVVSELNRLILKNKLRISGGIQYVQLQETVPGAEKPQQQTRREEGGARVVQSIFPGIGVTLTVEGSYANLRRFVRDVEADRQFVVINTVELEGVTDTSAPVVVTPPDGTDPNAAAAAPSSTRGTLVSLRLDMAAYFRRAGAASGG